MTFKFPLLDYANMFPSMEASQRKCLWILDDLKHLGTGDTEPSTVLPSQPTLETEIKVWPAFVEFLRVGPREVRQQSMQSPGQAGLARLNTSLDSTMDWPDLNFSASGPDWSWQWLCWNIWNELVISCMKVGTASATSVICHCHVKLLKAACPFLSYISYGSYVFRLAARSWWQWPPFCTRCSGQWHGSLYSLAAQFGAASRGRSWQIPEKSSVRGGGVCIRGVFQMANVQHFLMKW